MKNIVKASLLLACYLSNSCFAKILEKNEEISELSWDTLNLSDLSIDSLTLDESEMGIESNDLDGNAMVERQVRRRLEWEEGNPRAVWMMSFPESGIAHVMNLIQQASGWATATNYGHVYLTDGEFTKSNHSVHVYKNGPVWYNLDLEKPTEKVATRTHGTGYCLFCHPKLYYNGNFWWKSAGGVRIVDGKREKLLYDPADIEEMIHLIRDPYDNVVARFYSYVGLMRNKRPDLKIDELFPLDKNGFQKWCKMQDDGYYKVDMQWLPENLRKLAKKVPCRQEFIKYARFHSEAYKMARFRKIDSRFMKFDQFAKDQEAAIRSVNDFLGYPVNNTEMEQTIKGDGIWNFKKFYDLEDMYRIERLIRNLSTPAVWFYIRDYTPQFYEDQSDNPDVHRIKEGNEGMAPPPP